MILQEEYIREILLEFELEKRSSPEYGNLYEYYSGERLDELAPLVAIARALPMVARSAAQISGNATKVLSNSFKNGVLNLSKNVTKSLSNAAKEATDLLKALEDKGISSSSEDDEKKGEAKKAMESIMSQFTQFMNDAAEPLKYSKDKNTEYHQALKDFGSKVGEIDKMWTGGVISKPRDSLSGFDFNDLEGVFSYTEGLPEDFGSEETEDTQMQKPDTFSDKKKMEKLKGAITDTYGISSKLIDGDKLESMLGGLLGAEDAPGPKSKINPNSRRGAGGKK